MNKFDGPGSKHLGRCGTLITGRFPRVIKWSLSYSYSVDTFLDGTSIVAAWKGRLLPGKAEELITWVYQDN